MAWRTRIGWLALLAVGVAGPAAAGPRIACREPVYDFGEASDTGGVEHAFVIRNDGDAPLRLGRLHACCGGSLSMTVTNLAAGTNAEARAALTLRGRSGRQHKSFHIGSDDPATPQLQLRFQGTVVSSGPPGPPQVDFGVIDPETAADEEVRIACGTGILFSVTGVVSCVTGVVGRVLDPARAEAHSILIRTEPLLPVGALRGTVRVLTDCDKMPVVEVAVRGVVAADLVVVPSEIVLSGAARSEAVTRYLAVWSRTGRPFRVLQVAPLAVGMQVEQQPLPTGGYRIALRGIPPSKDLNGASLRIVTDLHSSPELMVPFRFIPAGGEFGQD